MRYIYFTLKNDETQIYGVMGVDKEPPQWDDLHLKFWDVKKI